MRVNLVTSAGFGAVPLLRWVLNRIPAGLVPRALGEHHHAACAPGHKVRLVRVCADGVGGAMARFGGAYISIARVLQWTERMAAGASWISLASWSPQDVLAGAWLFAGVTVLQLRAQAAGIAIPVQLLVVTTYIVIIFVLVLISARQKRGRSGGGAAPGSLGQSFHVLR